MSLLRELTISRQKLGEVQEIHFVDWEGKEHEDIRDKHWVGIPYMAAQVEVFLQIVERSHTEVDNSFKETTQSTCPTQAQLTTPRYRKQYQSANKGIGKWNNTFPALLNCLFDVKTYRIWFGDCLSSAHLCRMLPL